MPNATMLIGAVCPAILSTFCHERKCSDLRAKKTIDAKNAEAMLTTCRWDMVNCLTRWPIVMVETFNPSIAKAMRTKGYRIVFRHRTSYTKDSGV